MRPPTLTATVAEHIREAIVRGQFIPGAPLHEVELSKSLGISRGTVREALRHLQDENLVDIVPHQGSQRLHGVRFLAANRGQCVHRCPAHLG